MSFWSNKNVLVTGGSSGLGLAIAGAFAAEGARVCCVGLEPEGVEAAARELAVTGAEILPLAADIRKQEDVARIVSEIHKHWGPLDVLVNNAGRSMRGTVRDTSPEQFRELLELNFISLVRMTQAFLNDLISTKGHVVNIGSLAAKSAARYVGAYPASKHAVAAFSQQLRLELGPSGVHVLLVCPGPIARSGERLYPLEGAEKVPEAARKPGAGVKVRAIDPDWLARRILLACQRRELELVVPRKARLLFALSELFPRLGDWLILRFTPRE